MTEPAENEPEEPQEPVEGQDPKEPEEEQEDKSPSSREARYRARTREAEAERDGLRGRLEKMQKAEASRIAMTGNTGLVRGEDLFDIGAVPLADMLSEEGDIDPEKVQGAIDALRADRAYLFNNGHRVRDPGQGIDSYVKPENSWANALKRT